MQRVMKKERWPRRRRVIGMRFGLSRIFICTCILFGVSQARAKGIDEIISSILESRDTYDDQLLRYELDDLSIDRDDLPSRDKDSGAFNIPGRTPRDKAVDEFLKSLGSYRLSLENAQRARQSLVDDLLEENAGRVAFRVVVKSDSPSGERWLPLRLSARPEGSSPVELVYLPGFDEAHEFELLHTVLPAGTHSIRISGVAAAVSQRGVRSLSPLRDPQSFDQVMTFNVKGGAKPFAQLNLVFSRTEGGLRLEPEDYALKTR